MKKIFLLICIFSTLSCSYFKQDDRPAKYVNGMQFVTITLPNQLEVLLVHDARFKKSSAAMAVMVGSMEDPLDSQGMAHYLEHMLFLGTQEFPKADEYSTYMETNGGWDNAYTADELTNYMFEIDNAAMEGALHRFSRFFVSPLFDEQFLDREKNAVNSEFEKNIKQDGWRLDRFTNLLSKPNHPYAKFSTGSTQTLKSVTRADVINFYRKYYSSNNMKLVVMSAQPMKNLEVWVQKYFIDVPNFSTQRPKYEPFYFDPRAQNRLHFVKSIQDSEDLSILFNIPDSKEYWASKPTAILSKILGHEGKGSLLSYLQKKGWALELSAGSGAWRTFSVDITLTPEGRVNYEQVISSVFAYINFIKKNGYEEYLYNEEKAIRQIDLDNLEPSSAGNRAAWFASQITDYPVDDFLERNFLLSEYSKENFAKFLSYMRADNSHIIISTKNEKTDKKEDIFGVEYRSVQLPAMNQEVPVEFLYPEKNKYIPTEFTLVGDKKVAPPEKLELKGKGEIFVQQDTDLGIAKGIVQLNFYSDIENTPQNDALSALYVLSKIEELREWSYPLNQGRYHYEIEAPYGDEMTISITGYTQQLASVLMDVISDEANQRRLDEVKVTEAIFKSVKEKFKKDLTNIDEQVAMQRLYFEFGKLADSKGLRWQEVLKFAEKATLTDVQQFGKKFFTKAGVRGVVYGNVKSSEYLQVVEKIYKALGMQGLDRTQLESKRSQYRVVPNGKSYSMRVKGKNNNHAMMALYKMKDWSVEDQAKTYILDQILSQPYFSELRTNQQLGYVARGGGQWQWGYIGLTAALQSGKYNAKDLFQKSDEFLNKFLKEHIEKVTDKDLEPVRSSLVNEMLTKPNTLSERFTLFENAALKYDGRFKIREELAEKIKTVSLADYKKFIQVNFFDYTPSKVILYYEGPNVNNQGMPGTVFEKPEDVKDWVITYPYKNQ